MLDFYYSNKLNSKIISGVNSVYNAILSLKNHINLFGYNQDDCRLIMTTIMKDYPELYYVNFNLIQYQPSSQGTGISLNYYDCDINLFEEKLDKICEEIDKSIRNDSTDYQVIKAVYDVVVNNVSYDYDAFNRFGEVDQSSHDELQSYFDEYGTCFNMYGVIVNKKAVCMGIAHTMKYLLNRYRIEAAFLECEHYADRLNSSETYPHAINVVEVQNEFYYLDASKGKLEDVNMIRYDFFMVNQERVENYYQITEQFDCNFDSIDYYKENDLIFDNVIKLRRFLESASYQRTNGLILFKYKGKVKKSYLEKVIKENVSRACGMLYELVGYVVIDNYGYCKIVKR